MRGDSVLAGRGGGRELRRQADKRQAQDSLRVPAAYPAPSSYTLHRIRHAHKANPPARTCRHPPLPTPAHLERQRRVGCLRQLPGGAPRIGHGLPVGAAPAAHRNRGHGGAAAGIVNGQTYPAAGSLEVKHGDLSRRKEHRGSGVGRGRGRVTSQHLAGRGEPWNGGRPSQVERLAAWH